MLSSKEIRQKFLDFFKEKGHVIISSSSLLSDDPSVLLTTAGMQQFKKYYTGEADPIKDFGSRNAASIQKSFRTSDIEEVGDKTHLTFFEMLGNFSFGGYFKKGAIQWAFEFVNSILGVSADRISVTIFKGWGAVPEDEESFRIWHKDIGLPKDKIVLAGMEDNFWGPTGSSGPCGPTTEIYVDGVEIWNIVFNEYFCDVSRDTLLTSSQDVKLEKLGFSGVDTGMGFERLMSVLQGTDDIFETDLLHPLFSKVRESAPQADLRVQRILTDHLRSAVFLVGDGVRPSNKEAGYILRRLLRRILAYQIKYDIHADLFSAAAAIIKETFGEFYPALQNDAELIAVLENEKAKFQKAVSAGLKEISKYVEIKKAIDAETAFYLYETFGLPLELIKEFAPADLVKNLARDAFEDEFKKHQQISRAGADKKFGGHGLLLDTGELKAANEEELKIVIRLHTATHLLQAALRKVLGNEVKQMGSDITVERTRFDFTFPRKLTFEEITRVEKEVNEVVKKDLPVGFKELPKSEAEKTGALYFFKEKYPDPVKVYYVGHSLETAYSKEFCGGPHVSHTAEIGNFKIVKEEAVSSGVRRIRATVK